MKTVGICFLLSAGLLATACSKELNEGLVRAGVAQSINDTTITSAVFWDKNGHIIRQNDDFQITLVSAFICDFREGGEGFDVVASSNKKSQKCGDGMWQGVDTRGEISILAGFGFRGSADTEGLPEERLVYFGDDVRESGQLLNFLNLPLYGPAPYQLATSRLSLTILELDQEEVEKQSAFLESVASAGASFASPVQGKVLGVLASIGSALIKSNKDDREFRFDVGFDVPFLNDNGTPSDPSAGEAPIHRVPLREGYLALIRRENRSDKSHFTGLKICPARGVIAVETCVDDTYLDTTTWLLLRVSKEHESVVDATLTRTLQDALTARKGTVTAADFTSINDALRELTKSPPAQ